MKLWLCALLAMAGCTRGTPVDPTYAAEVDAWRSKRLERLTAADGWLTLVGLHWLQDGSYSLGAASGRDIELPAGHAPPDVGTLTVHGGTAQFTASPNSAVTLQNGAPVQQVALVSDANNATATVVKAGSVSMHLIDRGGALALRVRDAASTVRRDFAGLHYFPVDPAWRIEATFEPANPPRQVVTPTVAGTSEKQESPGTAVFTVQGTTYRLDTVSDPGTAQLFIVFADQTNGKQTYGTGRFLYADPPQNGRLVLDFNKAFNPPCAFTPFATCPLPPPQNRLGVAVVAGELRYH